MTRGGTLPSGKDTSGAPKLMLSPQCPSQSTSQPGSWPSPYGRSSARRWPSFVAAAAVRLRTAPATRGMTARTATSQSASSSRISAVACVAASRSTCRWPSHERALPSDAASRGSRLTMLCTSAAAHSGCAGMVTRRPVLAAAWRSPRTRHAWLAGASRALTVMMDWNCASSAADGARRRASPRACCWRR